MEMWCPDDTERDSWDWVEPTQIVLLLLLLCCVLCVVCCVLLLCVVVVVCCCCCCCCVLLCCCVVVLCVVCCWCCCCLRGLCTCVSGCTWGFVSFSVETEVRIVCGVRWRKSVGDNMWIWHFQPAFAARRNAPRENVLNSVKTPNVYRWKTSFWKSSQRAQLATARYRHDRKRRASLRTRTCLLEANTPE